MSLIFNRYLIHCFSLVSLHVVSQSSVSLSIQHPLQWYRKTSEILIKFLGLEDIDKLKGEKGFK